MSASHHCVAVLMEGRSEIVDELQRTSRREVLPKLEANRSSRRMRTLIIACCFHGGDGVTWDGIDAVPHSPGFDWPW